MTGVTKLIALIKREILEHPAIWRVPLILIGIALLVKLSLSFGNLSLNINLPEQLQLDDELGTAVNAVVAKALNTMNYVIMLVMFVVSIFYALSSLFNERQDQSVLFWRSLPISDNLTVTSKLLVALVLVPVVIIVAQVLVAVLFFGTDAFGYLSNYLDRSLEILGKILLWSMLPIITWCLLCSEIAKKNPFLLAFISPIILILVDKLFLNGTISQTFVINRLTGVSDYNLITLIWGVIFSAVCYALAVIKRGERF